MRASTARLSDSAVRLSDLSFPATGVLLPRTRLTFVHLDNLISFAKADRDGRVDAYLAGYLPDEVILLFFRNGEPVNAGAIRPETRSVVSVDEALRRLQADRERGEATYAAAPAEQLDWMFASCSAPAHLRFVNETDPEKLFPVLTGENFSGIVELVSSGRVSYLNFASGRFASGYFHDRPEGISVVRYIEQLFRPTADDHPPAIAVSTMDLPGPMPAQATGAQLRQYQEVRQRISEAVRKEWPEGERTIEQITSRLAASNPAVRVLVPDSGDSTPVAPADLTRSLAEWVTEVLRELEVVQPGSAVPLLRQATREQRFVLQAAGFYHQLPWPVEW